jgi:hypothetical protein
LGINRAITGHGAKLLVRTIRLAIKHTECRRGLDSA